ncbi:MAG: insulinase family protein [Nitrospinae bacterium]|nr:insulinase family protein [Nitrospinota bacterium]
MKVINQDIKRDKLENGIRLLTEKIPYLNSVSLGIWVNVGSRHEAREKNGISHFLEHLIFKGTEKRTAMRIAMEMDSIGGQFNAQTSYEYTCFYAKTLDYHVDLAVDLLTDIVHSFVVRDEEMEKERLVIFEEIKMVKDSPSSYIQELFMEKIYQTNHLGLPIAGSVETVSKITRQDILDHFHENYFNPDEIIIAAAGNIEHEEIKAIFSKSLRKFEGRRKKNILAAPEFSVVNYHHDKDYGQVNFSLGVKGVDKMDERRYCLFILENILGGSMSSRLFQKIREQHGLVYEIYAFSQLFSDSGLIEIGGATSPEHFCKVVDLIVEEIRKMKTEKVDAQEINKAKEQTKGNIILSLENTSSRMHSLARQEANFKRLVPLDEIISKIEKVTEEDIMELASTLLDFKKFSMVSIGTLSKNQIPVLPDE